MEARAVVLVGGEGTRLRPLTCNIPKPMVPIANRPFLEYIIQHLARFGIRDIILALCYLPEAIQGHFGDGSAWGVRLSYALDKPPLGTAGAVKKVQAQLQGTTFVLNGDVFTDLDLGEMLAFHRERGAMATVALTSVDDPRAYGLVEIEEGGRIRQFIEKPGPEAFTSRLINAGTYILEAEALAEIPPGRHYMFEQQVFPSLLEKGAPLYGFTSDAYWIDVGTPERYLQLHHDLLFGMASADFTHQNSSRSNCFIHPSALLRGPVVLGDNCSLGARCQVTGPAVLGPGCVIGPEAVIEEAVLWAGVRIGAKATLRRCLVGCNTVIEDNARIAEGVVIGDNALIGEGNRLERGLRLGAGKTLEPNAITF